MLFEGVSGPHRLELLSRGLPVRLAGAGVQAHALDRERGQSWPAEDGAERRPQAGGRRSRPLTRTVSQSFGRAVRATIAARDPVGESLLPHCRFHDLRHIHATNLLMAGVPVHVVADRVGHADPSITVPVHAHVLREHATGVAVCLRIRLASPVPERANCTRRAAPL